MHFAWCIVSRSLLVNRTRNSPLSWNPNAHNRFRKSSPHYIFLKIHFNIITHLCLGLPSGVCLPLVPLSKCCMHFPHFPYACYMSIYFIRLDIFILMILGKDYKLLSIHTCNVLISPRSSALEHRQDIFKISPVSVGTKFVEVLKVKY